VESARTAAGALAAAADDRALVPLLTATLRSFPILLVLDDFEQNLVTGGATFSDEGVAAQLGLLVGAGGRSRLLVTCRHPLPGFEYRLHEVSLPPLSDAEMRKSFLRLPGLRALDATGQQTVRRVLGGHPRALELLDALLRQGRGRQTVVDKLSTLASQAGVSPRDPRREVQRAIDEAVDLALQDVLFDELLGLLDPLERRALDQIAPSNLPVAPADVATLLDAPDAAAEACSVWPICPWSPAWARTATGSSAGWRRRCVRGTATAIRPRATLSRCTVSTLPVPIPPTTMRSRPCATGWTLGPGTRQPPGCWC
jgi:hypothetical protein